MTVQEFLAWDGGEDGGALWQLRDGVPEMMAPASDAHASIQGELHRLIENHLVARGGMCRSAVTPGVIPRVRSERNMLVPDVGVTCAPPSRGRALPSPVVLIEVLSPSNEPETRANVWAYTTIPSVLEIALVNSTEVAAEVWRRQPDGSWPAEPDPVKPDDDLRLNAIGFTGPLRAFYRTSGLL